MNLAFAVLAHDEPANLVRLVRRLTSDGDLVVIHWDRKSRLDIREYMSGELTPERLTRVRFAKRHRVSWGAWSMIEATLACLEEIASSGETIDYVILLSGVDYPTRPLSQLKSFLAADANREYIESVNPEKVQWVVGGYNAERLTYRFYFNWKRHPRLYSWSISLQKFLGLKRKMPDGLEPRLGSQWWALTWPTAREVLARGRESNIQRFFRRSGVPDENFFQTLVADIVPDERIAQHSLTFYHFSIYGKPLVLYGDHVEFLLEQPYFFARKISSRAESLRDALDESCAANADAPYSKPVPTKNVSSYDSLVYIHRHAPPNRRVMASQHNVELGDLDWNRVPYFVLMAFGNLDIQYLRAALNADDRIRCYGELFAPGHIDYDLPCGGHPGYPSDAWALRDHSPSTFLYDILHLEPQSGIIGFVASIGRADLPFLSSLRDPRALPVFLVPSRLFRKAANPDADVRTFYEQRLLQDLLDTSGYPGWRPPLVCVYEDRLCADEIDRIKTGILAWHGGGLL